MFERGTQGNVGWQIARLPSFGRYQADQPPGQNVPLIHTLLEHYHELVLRVRGTVNAPLTDIGAQIADRVSDRIYLFRAIRFNAGWVEFGSSTRLAPDARNLAEVLSNFGQNSARYRRFNNFVREVSDAKVPYLKTIHSVALTEWLIQNASEDLKDMVELLTSALRSTAPDALSATV